MILKSLDENENENDAQPSPAEAMEMGNIGKTGIVRRMRVIVYILYLNCYTLIPCTRNDLHAAW